MSAPAHRRAASRRALASLALVLVLAQGLAPSLHALASAGEAESPVAPALSTAETGWTAAHPHDAASCPVCQELARSAGMQPQPLAAFHTEACHSAPLSIPGAPHVPRLDVHAFAPPRAPPAVLRPLPS